jgi:ABC-type sugar transport system ATPase subunit
MNAPIAAGVEEQVDLLAVEGVQKRFGGVHALRDAHLRVRSGEVHALLGENGAGKSTLVKIIAGVHSWDSGRICWNGEPIDEHGLGQARTLGIRIIHQQLNAIEHLTVCENLVLGNEATRLGFLNKTGERRRAAMALARLGVDLDLDTKAGTLRVAERQLIEIARALGGGDARLLVMDEPTASLGERDVERLFRVIRGLRDEGLGIVYISHKLEEVFEIADRVTVLRDGSTVGTVSTASTTHAEVVSMMVRREVAQTRAHTSGAQADVKLSVHQLVTDAGLDSVSFDLHKGEVLGVYGLLGSGRTELAHALFGVDPVRSGSISIDGRPVRFNGPREARQAGLGFVPEERKQAAYPFLSVRENITTAALDRLSRWAWLDRRLERQQSVKIVRDLGVRTPGIEELMLRLSGGNQQKVIVGRWLLRDVPILILDDPTSGVDIGAKDELYNLIAELTLRGTSVLISSSELAELMAISDRIMVLHQGRVAGILPRSAFSQRAIIELAVAGQALETDAAASDWESSGRR